MSAAPVCDWCDAPDVPAYVMWDGAHACAAHRADWYVFAPGARLAAYSGA